MGLTMKCWHDWLYQEMVGCTWQTIQNFYRQNKKHYFLRQFPLSNAHWQCSVVCLEFPSPIFLMFIILISIPVYISTIKWFISQFFWLKLPFLVVDAPHWLPKNIAQARPDPAGASVLKFKPQRMKRRAALSAAVTGGCDPWMLNGWSIRKKGHLGFRDT